VMLEEYLNGPKSVAERLLSGAGGTTAAAKAARKRAVKDILDEWQREWNELARQENTTQ